MAEAIESIQESLEMIFAQPIPEDKAKRLYNWGILSGFSIKQMRELGFWLRIYLLNPEPLSSFIRED